MAAGPPRQAASDTPSARGPQLVPSQGALSEPEDTIRPSNQPTPSLTDGLRARAAVRFWDAFVLGCVSMQPLDPLRFMLIGLAGWVNEQQRDVIDYL